MAISSTPTLTEIEAEFGGSGLVDCANKAGLSLPVSMLDFVGMSSELIVMDSGGYGSGITAAYQGKDSNSIARRVLSDIELGGEGNSTNFYNWGKAAIDLSSYNPSNWSSIEMVLRMNDFQQFDDFIFYGKWSNTQFDVETSRFGSNYDFKGVETDFTSSFATYTFTPTNNLTYLNLCGWVDTGSGTYQYKYFEIDSIKLV